LGPSAQLRTINQKLYDDEVRRVKNDCALLGEEIKTTLRQAALELVATMHERLSGHDPKTGKPKVFRDSLVSNLVTFLNTFEVRNIMGDTELSGALKEMRDLLKGVSTADLRTNTQLRGAVAAKVTEIKDELASLVVVQGRSVKLPDEDPEVPVDTKTAAAKRPARPAKKGGKK